MSELDVLARDLAKAAQRAPEQAREAVDTTALVVKKTARSLAPHGPHTPSYANSITYDIYELLWATEARIGPDKSRRQGALGNLLEYGSVNNAPTPHLGPALMANEQLFEDNLARIVGKIL